MGIKCLDEIYSPEELYSNMNNNRMMLKMLISYLQIYNIGKVYPQMKYMY